MSDPVKRGLASTVKTAERPVRPHNPNNMSQLILSTGVNYKSFVKRFIRNFQPGPYFLGVSLVVCTALVTIITLTFSAQQVTKGYVLNSLDAQHQDLSRENAKHDFQISQARSLSNIEQSPSVRHMRRPGQVVFVSSDTAIASR